MSTRSRRWLAALMALALLTAAACGGDDDGGDSDGGDSPGTTVEAEAIDYEAIGLWDDGACDESKPPLKLGLITAFETPVLSLEDQALALEASAEAFNERGGANGSCIQVFPCDDGADTEKAIACARQMQDEGVHATVNDQVTSGQGDVADMMAQANIPRIAANVANEDWDDQNAYPMDASGTGVTFMLPQAMVEADANKIGIVRIDIAAASAMKGLLSDAFEGKATFPVDIPVPGGTTDFSQFILGAQNGGADGVMLALGEQEAIQVVRAGQQLGTDLVFGSSLGTYGHSTVSELGDFAEQMVFMWSFPPATFDLPVYEALRADLAASGEENLQPENLKASPMRSWIGLYATLHMIRQAGLTEFSGPALKTMLDAAKDVPMLDIFGGENWTPDTDHPGLFKRAGTNHWAIWSWDPEAEAPGGLEGNFVKDSQVSFDEVLCGTIFGAPEPC